MSKKLIIIGKFNKTHDEIIKGLKGYTLTKQKAQANYVLVNTEGKETKSYQALIKSNPDIKHLSLKKAGVESKKRKSEPAKKKKRNSSPKKRKSEPVRNKSKTPPRKTSPRKASPKKVLKRQDTIKLPSRNVQETRFNLKFSFSENVHSYHRKEFYYKYMENYFPQNTNYIFSDDHVRENSDEFFVRATLRTARKISAKQIDTFLNSVGEIAQCANDQDENMVCAELLSAELIDAGKQYYPVPGAKNVVLKLDVYLTGWEDSQQEERAAVYYDLIEKYLGYGQVDFRDERSMGNGRHVVIAYFSSSKKIDSYNIENLINHVGEIKCVERPALLCGVINRIAVIENVIE